MAVCCRLEVARHESGDCARAKASVWNWVSLRRRRRAEAAADAVVAEKRGNVMPVEQRAEEARRS
jgi:hypothetical protein